MKLEPDHLGMMRVKMSVDENNVMHARIQVESIEARTMIENSLHRLRESLAELGIKVEKFNVDVRQDQQGQQQNAGNDDDLNHSGRGLNTNTAESTGGTAAENGEETGLAGQNTNPVNKYDYSTLEWVA